MFRNLNKRTLISVVCSGIFYGLSFPPVNFYFLIYFSIILLIGLAVTSKSFSQVFLRSYFVFFTASLVAISWISLSGMRQNADTFLIFAGAAVIIIYPLFFVPPAVLLYYASRKNDGRISVLALACFPFLWTGMEYLSTLGQINFPWLFAGNSQTYNLNKIQFAEFTGVFGVSFWICVISVMGFYFFRKVSDNSWKSFTRIILFLVVIAGIYFLPDAFNSFRKNYPETGKIRVGIVQPNIDPWKKWGGKQDDLILDYAEQIRSISESNTKLIILPETALPYYFRERHFEERFNILKNLCDSINIPLLIGTPDLEYYKDQSQAPPDAKIMRNSGLKYDTYNTAVLFEPGKEKDDFQKHYKIKLVIGSERIPYQELFPFTKNLIEWGVGIGNWQIGTDTNLFMIDGRYKFNTAICYESVYPGFYAKFINKGAEFSAIITNDGWWGKFFGTYQHNMFAVFRAIENRRWIARCANTGISDFIDPEGNKYDETNIDVKANIVKDIGLIEEKTFYTVYGDLFSQLCVGIGAGIFLISIVIRTKEN